VYRNVCVLLYQLRSAFSFITVSAEFFVGQTHSLDLMELNCRQIWQLVCVYLCKMDRQR